MRWLKTFAHGTESVVTRVSRALNIVAPICIGILMLLITADVVGRFFFKCPIPGTISISEYVFIGAVYFGVAYCAVVKSHVTVDVVASRLGERVRAIIDSVTGLFALAIFALLAWSSVAMVVYSQTTSEVSLDPLQIPVWPFRTIVVIGVVMLWMVLLTQLFHLVARGLKK